MLGACVHTSTVLLAAILPALALLAAAAAARSAACRRDEGDRALRRAVAALRARLSMERRDGFVLRPAPPHPASTYEPAPHPPCRTQPARARPQTRAAFVPAPLATLVPPAPSGVGA
jgi:hypothetical protein